MVMEEFYRVWDPSEEGPGISSLEVAAYCEVFNP